MKKLGIRTSGTEQRFEEIICDYLKEAKEKVKQYPFLSSFRYYEIGTAEGYTLKAVSEIFKENLDKFSAFLCDGIDLTNGYSLNIDVTNQLFKPNELALYYNGVNNYSYLNPPKTRLLLFDDPRSYTKSLPDNSLDIVLVDACHSKPEVIADFLSVENKVKKGGLVFFHDFGELEAGSDLQVDGNYIDVRNATKELGLFDNKRPGWIFVEEIHGSRKDGGDGNNFGVFKKL